MQPELRKRTCPGEIKGFVSGGVQRKSNRTERYRVTPQVVVEPPILSDLTHDLRTNATSNPEPVLIVFQASRDYSGGPSGGRHLRSHLLHSSWRDLFPRDTKELVILRLPAHIHTVRLPAPTNCPHNLSVAVPRSSLCCAKPRLKIPRRQLRWLLILGNQYGLVDVVRHELAGTH